MLEKCKIDLVNIKVGRINIFIGCNQGLTVSFILLTSAEMIGARDGLGYYVKNYSDFGDYTRTILGIIVIGIVVVAISFLFNKLQHRVKAQCLTFFKALHG